MKKRKIGFNAYMDDDDDDEQKNPTDFFEQARSQRVEAIKKIISEKYDATGDVHDCEFRTTMELQYELQEMMDVSASNLNDAMNEMQFKLQYIDDRPHWVLYRKFSGIQD